MVFVPNIVQYIQYVQFDEEQMSEGIIKHREDLLKYIGIIPPTY